MLGVIIVDFKGSERTVKFIREETTKISLPHKVTIVINAAEDEKIQSMAKKLDAIIVTERHYSTNDSTKEVFILPQKENLGFARGNNIGAKFLIDNFGCDYLLFTNNDIIIKSPDTIETLIDVLKTNDDIGLVGPEVIGPDGRRQSPEPYVPMVDRYVKMYLYTFFHSRQAKIKRFSLDYSDTAQEGRHFRVMGSFFIMPTATFNAIGGFDPNTFLYAEEMILAKRLETIGKKVYFCPRVTVIHDHGATTSKHLTSIKRFEIQAESEKYYYTAYCGVPFWKATFFSLFARTYQRLKSLSKL